MLSEWILTVLLHWALEENIFTRHPTFIQKDRKHKRESEREKEGVCLSGQCLLIATRHTSPQLSQIAIEKWPVMQLLANPGPWLPSIIKSCLSRGPLCRLSRCVVSLSHLLATSSPAASAELGIRFPSATSHSAERIRGYGPNEESEIATLYIPTATAEVRWWRSRNKMGFDFSFAHFHWAWEWYLQKGKALFVKSVWLLYAS